MIKIIFQNILVFTTFLCINNNIYSKYNIPKDYYKLSYHYIKAFKLYNKKRYSSSIKILNKSIRQNSIQDNIFKEYSLILLIKIYITKNNLSKVKKLYNTLATKYPSSFLHQDISNEISEYYIRLYPNKYPRGINYIFFENTKYINYFKSIKLYPKTQYISYAIKALHRNIPKVSKKLIIMKLSEYIDYINLNSELLNSAIYAYKLGLYKKSYKFIQKVSNIDQSIHLNNHILYYYYKHKLLYKLYRKVPFNLIQKINSIINSDKLRHKNNKYTTQVLKNYYSLTNYSNITLNDIKIHNKYNLYNHLCKFIYYNTSINTTESLYKLISKYNNLKKKSFLLFLLGINYNKLNSDKKFNKMHNENKFLAEAPHLYYNSYPYFHILNKVNLSDESIKSIQDTESKDNKELLKKLDNNIIINPYLVFKRIDSFDIYYINIHLIRGIIFSVNNLRKHAKKELYKFLNTSTEHIKYSIPLSLFFKDKGQYLLSIQYANYLNNYLNKKFNISKNHILNKKLYTLIYPKFYSKLVSKYSKQYNVDEYIVYSIIHQESKFNKSARSYSNAIGLMQVMPRTGQYLHRKIFKKFISIKNVKRRLLDPKYNIKLGVYYIKLIYNKLNNLEIAIAGYNGGPNRMMRLIKEHNIDNGADTSYRIKNNETGYYTKKVFSNIFMYKKIYQEL